jgi:AcrR family transcriptional regulator
MPAKHPGGRPRDERADAAIQQAVQELLAETGYEGVTMDDIARRAGVSKATIYRRWRSKAEMVFATSVHAPELRPDLPTATLHGDVLAFLRSVTKTLSNPQIADIAGPLISELAHNPQLATRFQGRFLAAERADVAEMLDSARARGELRREIDPATAHLILTGPVFFALYTYRLRVDDAMLASLADLITAGLKSAGDVPATQAKG